MKKFIKKILLLIRILIFGYKADEELFIKHLKKRGMSIGKRVRIYDPQSCVIDETRPWMIEIGDDVQITHGVIILTHGYDWAVLKGVYGEVLGSAGKVKIGNNVFIGMNSIILKGVTIGNNVIIGAGSLINKDIPNNCVVAGSPAKIVMSLDDYYKKRKNLQLHEAQELVRSYRNSYGKDPESAELSEFFWLYTNNENDLDNEYLKKMKLIGNFDNSINLLNNNISKYKNLNDFLKNIK